MKKEQIKQLISDSRLDEALHALLKLTKQTHLEQNALMIASRHAELINQQIRGIESPAELDRRRNDIAHALLQLLEQLPENPPLLKNGWQPYRQPLLWASLVILVALAAWYFIGTEPAPAAKLPSVSSPADSLAYNLALEAGSIPALEAFLRDYPSSQYAGKAQEKIAELQQLLKFNLKAANALYRGGKIEKAYEALEKAMKINPDAPEVNELLTLLKK